MGRKKKSKISRFPVKKINTKISRKLVGLFSLVILALLFNSKNYNDQCL